MNETPIKQYVVGDLIEVKHKTSVKAASLYGLIISTMLSHYRNKGGAPRTSYLAKFFSEDEVEYRWLSSCDFSLAAINEKTKK